MKKTFTYCDLCKKRKRIKICPLCKKEICNNCSTEINSNLYICKSHLIGMNVPLDIIRKIYHNADTFLEGWYDLREYTKDEWLAVYTTDDGEISCIVKHNMTEMEKHILGSLEEQSSWYCSFIYHDGAFYDYETEVKIVKES